MKSLELNNNLSIYYDTDLKIIGRIPTNSNINESRSDNSLYMGLITNDEIKRIICDIFDIKKIYDFNNKSYIMRFYDEDIRIESNINGDGQIQLKIVGNGQMNYMYKKFIDLNNDLYDKKIAIFLDFKNKEVFFEELDNALLFLKKEEIDKLVEIVDESRNLFKNLDDVNNINAYIETTLNVRNSAVQKKFKNALMIEFGGKCALCNNNKKELLVASHIVPYCECDSVKEMIDVNNGLLLCINHDSLFDKGYISFDSNNGKIKISNNDIINHKLFEVLNINENLFLEKKHLTNKRKEYLGKHKLK